MASVKYGAMITELKGKVGGQVFQGGNNSFILRNNPYRKGFSSPRRQAANINMVQHTQAWRALSSSDQLAWAAIAADWTFTDRYGNIYQASGFQIFASYNSALTSVGGTAVTTPGTPTVPVDPGTVTVNYVSSVVVNLVWTNAMGANDFLLAQASPPLSPGSSGNNVKLLTVVRQNVSGLTTLNVALLYQAIFGVAPSGSVIKYKLSWRNSAWPRDYFVTDQLTTVP